MQEDDIPGHFCSPDEPIADCSGRILPTIVYPFTEGSNPRKARSFGQLSLASIGQRLSQAGISSPSALSSECGSVHSPSDDPDTAPGTEVSPSNSDGAPASLAERVLTKEWDRRFHQGLFRYDVRECTTKVRTHRLC